jgi:hypothetical protein
MPAIRKDDVAKMIEAAKAEVRAEYEARIRELEQGQPTHAADPNMIALYDLKTVEGMRRVANELIRLAGVIEKFEQSHESLWNQMKEKDQCIAELEAKVAEVDEKNKSLNLMNAERMLLQEENGILRECTCHDVSSACPMNAYINEEEDDIVEHAPHDGNDPGKSEEPLSDEEDKAHIPEEPELCEECGNRAENCECGEEQPEPSHEDLDEVPDAAPVYGGSHNGEPEPVAVGVEPVKPEKMDRVAYLNAVLAEVGQPGVIKLRSPNAKTYCWTLEDGAWRSLHMGKDEIAQQLRSGELTADRTKFNAYLERVA